MRGLLIGVLVAGASLILAAEAKATKVLPPTTIIRLTDAMVKQYIACRPSVERATAAARAAIPGMTRTAASQRRSAGGAALEEALKACGFPDDGPWLTIRHAVHAGLRNCCAQKLLLPDGERTEQGVAQVQAANRALLRRYKRAALEGRDASRP
jgi:hypothetical protein